MKHVSKWAARSVLALSASFAALGVAVNPASAALVTNGTNLAPIVFNGIADPGAAVIPGLSATLDLGAAVFAGNIVTFSYTFTNTTDSVADAFTITSRIRSFGFDVTASNGASLTGGSATGAYSTARLGDNFPSLGGLGGTRDICFRAAGGNNCTGGPNGLTSGQSTSGTLSLTFGSAVTQISLDDFIVRYQSIGGAPRGLDDSGIGIASGVPEPSTWAMMMVGFAGLALAGRRRKAALAAA